MLASLRSDRWTACPELVDDFIGIPTDIANYDATDYLETLHALEGNTSDTRASSIEEAYAQQIIANSRIASMKYRYFGVALWLTVSAVLTPILAAVLYFFRTRTSSGEVS